MRTGRFITFEGPEGGGKTTQAKRLMARLRNEGRDVIYTREPGGTPTGEAIRDILQHNTAGEPICDEAEVFLFAASRAQLVRAVILPALARGAVVVCDRFADSTTAYQGYGRGLPVDQMLAINAFAIGEATPDITLLLDIPVSIGFERIHGRQQELFQDADRIEREAREFHERVRAGYLELARRWPARLRLVDASRPPDEVEREIWEIVSGVLP
jgi:dTMP kinase